MATLSARALVAMLRGWRESGSAPAYSVLADRIRLLVLDGRIPLGTRIAAERDLAAHLGISRTTVSAAYGELRDAGYLASIRGSGSVARLPERAPVSIDAGRSGYLDFSKAAMPAYAGLADAAMQAASEYPAYLGDTGFDPIGLPVLRAAIADRYTARGLPTDPDQLMITIGAQHAIALLCRTLLARGDSAMVESPSYPNAYEAIRMSGARLVPVTVTTEDGWDEAGFEQAIQRSSPAIGYLMPDFHNPTGLSMPVDMRERILELAARHRTVLIADETMAELSIDRPGTRPPFAAHTDNGSVAVLIGSVGKTVWGGVRVGWIRAERSLIQKLARARMAGDLGTPVLEQLIVKNLLAEYDTILELRREQLRAGRDHLEALLADTFPDWAVPHVDGGLTTWVNLGHPVSSQLTLAVRNEGLLLAAGPRFGIDGAFERFLRIPFSHSADETERAVSALSRAWHGLSRLSLEDRGFLAEVV
ncbi:MAG: PLP-dependent aminotransferase family protein [Microbacteriaceae bacterium]|nr:PLP-dependent aminotransferase family protein [Microbacteriaceae bacterium]